ncbi:MAG: tetratricopeptide repeat protein [Spirochaetes bacterium]|nr:tetratricopeptide repeat protein [Spirochaetota bacterium]
MRGRNRKILLWVAPVVVLAILTSVASLYPQYLLDDEDYVKEAEGKKAKLPENIAFNIKVEKVPVASEMKCAINIKWDLKPEDVGEYIVARSDQIIDSAEKVAAARVIQTINASTSNTVMDNDCNPGSYYYVVLSAKSVMENKIVLYKNQNYTTAPLVIPAMESLFRVARIRATWLDNTRVRLTWDRAEKSGISYVIYRSRGVIDSEAKLNRAERLGVVVDAGAFLDEGITESGAYYYAVTTRVSYGPEDTVLVANENYTTSGVRIAIAKPPVPAPEPEKKEKQEKQEKHEKIVVISGDVDRILKRTYFVNRYDEAIEELGDLIAVTDNAAEAAKARLFIGRSYIELGRYRRALDYLILLDVKKYFPEDADFWEEFALTRVRNY